MYDSIQRGRCRLRVHSCCNAPVSRFGKLAALQDPESGNLEGALSSKGARRPQVLVCIEYLLAASVVQTSAIYGPNLRPSYQFFLQLSPSYEA